MADLGFFLLFRGSLLGVAPAPCGTKVLQEWWASSTTKLVVLRGLFEVTDFGENTVLGEL